MPTSKKQSSSLQEKAGISSPEITNVSAINQIKINRKQQPSSDELTAGILNGNRTALSRAITLVESTNPEHTDKANEVIKGCLPHANKSIRVGITGVPGVGKSTFIEAFGTFLTNLGKKVAVLAVDPSSSLSHGSILGDKTRMEELVKDENAFIRPSASGDTLGGVARKTRESIILCEAAGFDTIIIETVGVGQSETAVHSMVDFFLLLKISGAGDELQGIKRGIMEMADAIVINKADGDNVKKANQAKLEFNRALHLFPPKKSNWQPKVTTCSAITKDGIPEIWETISTYFEMTNETGFFQEKRKDQNHFWMMETINEQLKLNFYNQPEIISKLEQNKKAVQNDEISPFAAASDLLKFYFNKGSK
ncbi:methylmalonyl Co-A mutase-associated GTPase MeaB [Flavobacterium sp. JLP]|uniref:methylmalonyl Co-A mutase-associated GTPase MeaB n=1 Tax=unclassified Flavobacterium TaxID=196869 RepID=UPI00188B6205|nr:MULTISPECIES: methylmalonyl Co-A mutase-associated GTPase MeaB [unclassified Flavobacterium]MBF4493556.1 methylmalonyl Co-A mutase-associated GTPase MeaB [Flavobacterium sp. MR2016-29]MBF4508071.1 methylmalonyl Co-A mutase-associated GTPase MeaB [Flavobacterium sp. JLP]